jgi:hypothetical protein
MIDSDAFWKASSIPYKDCPQDEVDFVKPEWLDTISASGQYYRSALLIHGDNSTYKSSELGSCSGEIG